MVSRRRNSPIEALHSCFSNEAAGGEMLGRVGLAAHGTPPPSMPGMPLLPGGPNGQATGAGGTEREAREAGVVEECLPQICTVVAGLCGCSCLGDLFSSICSFLCNFLNSSRGEEESRRPRKQSREMREQRETVRVEEKRVMVRTQTSTSEEEDCPLLPTNTNGDGILKTRNTRRVETVQCSLSSSSASSYASAAMTHPLPLVKHIWKPLLCRLLLSHSSETVPFELLTSGSIFIFVKPGVKSNTTKCQW